MTLKKIIRILAILLLIVISFLILNTKGYHNKEDKGFIGYIGRLLNKTNTFSVAYFNIDKADVDVVWRCENGNTDILVRNGVGKENLNYDYGHEDFIVCYKDTFLCAHGFFSTNNNVPHDVQISIEKTPEGFHVKYVIDQEQYEIFLDNDRNVIREKDDFEKQ